MEAFKVFATLSLVDLMSNPLSRIRGGMDAMDKSVQSLSARFGNLAMSMVPLALAGGAVLGAFGKCVSTAAGFEDQMAKVGAISRASAEDMQLLEAKARELGASTQFTASEVGQAEQYLAMAGFSAKENIAALPGVLNLAAATATDLGRAADISSDILGAFGMKANEMGRVADVLAKTCSTANTDMEKLGDTMKYVAPVARTAGLAIEDTAAMAGLLGNVGIKGSQAGTSLKAMLNKLAAPAKEGQEALAKLGVTVKDQAGNLRSPIKVLGEMAGKLKTMGTAEQMAAMKAIVGEEAIAGFAELIEQGGIGKIEEYANKLRDAGGTCEEMAKTMNNTLAGDMRGMGSAFESVQITIGKLFIPVLRKLVSAITSVLRWIDKFAQHPIGKFILKMAAAISTAIIAITAFAGAWWGLSTLGGLISKVFLPLKAGLLGVSAPMLVIIGIAALLYAAWKTNFGGIADVLSGWWNKIKLIFEGVTAVFQNLTGASSEIRGELATEIKAAGLEKLVTNVSKVIYRIKEFFAGIWDGLNFSAVATAFAPAILKIRELFDWLGNVIGRVFGGKMKEGAMQARSWGQIIGGALTWSLEALGTIIGSVVNAIDMLISFVKMVCSVFTGDWDGAIEAAKNIWNTFIDNLMAFADLFGIGDWIRDAWDSACAWLDSIISGISEFGLNIVSTLAGAWDSVTSGVTNAWNFITGAVTGAWNSILAGIAGFGASLLAGITSAWEAVVSFFDGINLFESGAKLLSTFVDGIMSMVGSVVDSVSGVFAKVREFLPFSDAHEGPLSQLTLSGGRMMTTLAEGVKAGQGALTASVSGALGEAGKAMENFKPVLLENEALTLNANAEVPKVESPALTIPEAPSVTPEDTVNPRGHQEGKDSQKKGQSITITIQNLTLPDVNDAAGFVKNLQAAFQAEIGALEGIA